MRQTDQFPVPVDWYQKQAPETGQCVITITYTNKTSVQNQRCLAMVKQTAETMNLKKVKLTKAMLQLLTVCKTSWEAKHSATA